MAILPRQDETENDRLLDDGADHLRADIMGSMINSDPRNPRYLGRIGDLLTAHGAVGKMMKSPSADMDTGGVGMPQPSQPTPMAVPGGDPGAISRTPSTPTALPDTAPPLMRSGGQQPSLLGRIGRVAGRMGNIAGDIFAPGITALIPGSDLNKRIAANKAEAQRVEKEKEGLEERRIGVEESKEAREAAAAGQPKPKEESWKEFPGYEGPNGEPLEIEQNSGNLRSAVSQLPVKSATRTEKAAARPSEEDKAIADYLAANNLPDTGPNRDKARDVLKTRDRTPRQPTDREEWQKDHPGEPIENYWKAKGLAAGAAKEEMGEEAGKAAQQYADDYMKSKVFTGPGDEALMEKYFELAKPSSGFRMTAQQIEMLQKARDIMGSLEARGKHLFSPESPYFSDTQRKQIVKTMRDLQRARDEVKAGGAGGAHNFTYNGKQYANVPDDVYKKYKGKPGFKE